MEELELYLEKAQAADESISSFTEVVGNVPTPWEKGDVITFPATIKGNAFKTKIGNKKYEYIVVHVKSADGSERQANFFPPLFRRRARVCEWKTVDGVDVTIPTNDFVVAGGSIVEQLYTKKRKVNDVVLAVLGKSIKISEVHEVKSQEFGTNNPELAKVYDFEPEGWTIGDAPLDIPEDTTTDSDAVKEIENTYGNVGENGQHNGHEYVDLGLSSGLKWATCNIGANSPEEYGNYYTWGETETKETYDYCNHPTYDLTFSDLKSQGYVDSEGNLIPLHDAATANWGGNWRMPTYEEMEELEIECTWKWMTQNNVDGMKVTGPNGNSIFLPAMGDPFYYFGNLWSSTCYNFPKIKNLAYVLCWCFGNCYEKAYHTMGCGYRYYYSSIRPVLE